MRRAFMHAIFMTGLASMGVQVLLMQELLSRFQGNELTIGITLACWLLLSGIGAASATGAIRQKDILWIMLYLGLIPFVQVLAIRVGTFLILPAGQEAGPWTVIVMSAIILAPYTLVSGSLLSRYASTIRHTAATYRLDALGNMAGSALIAVLLFLLRDTIISLSILSMALIVAGILLTRHRTTIRITATAATAIILITLPFFADTTRSLQYHDEDILIDSNTPYGSRILTEYQGEINSYLDGAPLDRSSRLLEEYSHLPLLQRRNVSEVLVISSGSTGIIEELRKHNPSSVTLLIHPPILHTEKQREIEGERSLTIIEADPRRFMRESSRTFDAIVVMTPTPTTARMNRVYTKDFMAKLKKHLTEGGIYTAAIAPYKAAHTEESLHPPRIIASTAREVFENTRILPASQYYLLASDGPLPSSYANITINADYVTPAYLEDDLSERRMNRTEALFEKRVRMNTDAHPRAYIAYLSRWVHAHTPHPHLLLILPALLILTFFFLRPTEKVVFSTGILTISLQFILILIYQVQHGQVYHAIAILFALFMAGTVAGTRLAERIKPPLVLTEPFAVLIASICPFILLLEAGVASRIIIGGAIFILGSLGGFQFALADTFKARRNSLFYADLAGASLGAVCAATVLMPVLGIFTTALAFAGMKVISFIYLLVVKV